MKVTLTVQTGAKEGHVVRLRGEETIIGRRRGCDLRIPSAEVSRRHCLVSVHEGAVTVEDLASINGTFVNGRKLTGKQMVYPGDRIQVGPVCFVIDYPTPGSGKPSRSPPVAELTEEEELPVLEEAPDDSADKPIPMAGDSPSPAAQARESADVMAEIDEAGGLHLPQTEDLRNLLAEMDDKPRKQGRKKR